MQENIAVHLHEYISHACMQDEHAPSICMHLHARTRWLGTVHLHASCMQIRHRPCATVAFLMARSLALWPIKSQPRVLTLTIREARSLTRSLALTSRIPYTPIHPSRARLSSQDEVSSSWASPCSSLSFCSIFLYFFLIFVCTDSRPRTPRIEPWHTEEL